MKSGDELVADADRGRWDRRAIFLAMAALVSVLLVPFSPEGLEYVGLVLAGWCLVLALGSFLDKWSRDRS